MATELLLLEQPAKTLANGVTYALPARYSKIVVVGTAPTVSVDGVTFVALPADNLLAYNFIKSGAADTQVVLKRA